MKKVLALLLATTVLLGLLCACDTEKKTFYPEENETNETVETKAEKDEETKDEEVKDEETKGEETKDKETKEAAAGTVLDAPEASFDESIQDLYLYFTMPGENEGEVDSMEFTLDQVDDDTYLFYITDGPLKLNEIVFEVSESNGIAMYAKDVFATEFVKDTQSSQAELQTQLDEFMELVSFFLMAHADFEGCQYRKSDAFNMALTGEVYVYDLLQNGEVDGQIAVDKETGLLVSMTDTDGKNIFTVQEIKIGKVEIPDFKA